MFVLEQALGASRESLGSSSRSINLSKALEMEESSAVPIPCELPLNTRVLHVSCGSRHTLAVVDDGSVYSWGWGASGQVSAHHHLLGGYSGDRLVCLGESWVSVPRSDAVAVVRRGRGSIRMAHIAHRAQSVSLPLKVLSV